MIIIVRYIILILYGIVLLKPVLPIVDYLLRYDYYAQELCVMKDTPNNDCCGQCQVMDAIAKQEEQSPRNNSTQPSTRTSQSEEIVHEVITLYRSNTSLMCTHILPGHSWIDHAGILMRGYIRLPFTPPDIDSVPLYSFLFV